VKDIYGDGEMTNKVYDIVTEQILNLLDQGVVPWHQEWDALAGMPQNIDSKRPYSGFNLMYLWFLQKIQGWSLPYYLTYNGARKHGWHVRKGEKGNLVVFWKVYQKAVKNDFTGKDEEKQARVLRYYYLFNLAQIDGWTEADLPKKNEIEQLPTCENLINSFVAGLPEIKDGASPVYVPSKDIIYLPPITSYNESEYFYSSRFHETVHSTGAKKRLGRPGVVDPVNFGSEKYSLEELVAEIGAAFLSAMSGISGKVLEHNASYIQTWHSKLKENPTWIVKAASQAQKAVNYLLQKEASQ